MTNVADEIAGRCYRCLRPRRLCYCASLPTVPTRTHVVILQHPHERTHPFNTARLVGLCMPNSRVHVAYGGLSEVLRCEVPVPDDTVVLYPHPSAVDVATLPPSELPSTLLALDGTWAHSKRLYKDNPWLARLRHVRINPSEPSRYRIRKEPRADYVSTLEAIVFALRTLEPETPGLDTLVTAFDRMIDQQIDTVATSVRAGRTHRPRLRESRALSPLLGDPRLVVAYAESSLPAGDVSASRELVQFVAVRATNGDVFEAIVRPGGVGPTDTHLTHMGIARELLDNGESLAAARARFAAFVDGAPITAWTPTTLEWGAPLLPANAATTVLKTNYCNLRNRRAGYLEDVVAREAIDVPLLHCHGRAASRLACAAAVATWLRSFFPPPFIH